MNDIISTESVALDKRYFELKPTGLVITGQPDFDEWAQAGEVLKYIEGSVHWWLGDWLNYGENAYGEMYSQALDETGFALQTLTNDKYVANKIENYRRREILSWSHHQVVASLPPEKQDELLDLAEAEGWKRERLRKEVKQLKPPIETPPPPDGEYRCVIIDPPWPMQKIDRDIIPYEEKLDYPVMTIDEIKELKPPFAEDGCHVYLWTTHKYLPDAFEVFNSWNVRYECLLTWDKEKGMTPFSWMYSTEFVLFGRIGSLDLLKKGEKVVFYGERREHSRKPDGFYNLARLVSPEPRLDMFSREQRDGFDQWGIETEHFK